MLGKMAPSVLMELMKDTKCPKWLLMFFIRLCEKKTIFEHMKKKMNH
jgi:hypothetical protein